MFFKFFLFILTSFTLAAVWLIFSILFNSYLFYLLIKKSSIIFVVDNSTVEL